MLSAGGFFLQLQETELGTLVDVGRDVFVEHDDSLLHGGVRVVELFLELGEQGQSSQGIRIHIHLHFLCSDRHTLSAV